MPTILIITQVFPPDPASGGQHMSEAAAELGACGFRVVVLTADHGYDDPSKRYKRRETRGNVEVLRFPFSSLGKRSLLHRVFGGVVFSLQATVVGLFVRHLAAVLVGTAPPMAGLVGVFLSKLRRVPLKFWLMDLNPDQVVVLGKMSASHITVRLLRWANRQVFACAADVVVLDRFMRERVRQYEPVVPRRVHTLPPWPHQEVAAPLPRHENLFRKRHGLEDVFVIMYSGNHGLHSLDTLIEAAARLEDEPHIVFLFVGGGVGKNDVESCGLRNVRSLPYQPLETLRESLSAADVHAVVLGEAVVGINHPCKMYGALAVGRPILFVGPSLSHIGDILSRHHVGWQVQEGDVEGTVRAIREAAALSPQELTDLGSEAQRVIGDEFSKRHLRREFCDIVIAGF